MITCIGKALGTIDNNSTQCRIWYFPSNEREVYIWQSIYVQIWAAFYNHIYSSNVQLSIVSSCLGSIHVPLQYCGELIPLLCVKFTPHRANYSLFWWWKPVLKCLHCPAHKVSWTIQDAFHTWHSDKRELDQYSSTVTFLSAGAELWRRAPKSELPAKISWFVTWKHYQWAHWIGQLTEVCGDTRLSTVSDG